MIQIHSLVVGKSPGVEAGKRLTKKATVNRSLKSTKDHQASSIDPLPTRVELQT
jgi:hypothetical protein